MDTIEIFSFYGVLWWQTLGDANDSGRMVREEEWIVIMPLTNSRHFSKKIINLWA